MIGSPREIEKLLEKPEKDIDIGYACLLLSKDAFPDLDIQRMLSLFDGMARNVQIIYETSKDQSTVSDKRIGSLNTFLYRPGPWNAFGPHGNMVFKYDEESETFANPQALFLVFMLRTKRGTCSTMPALWYIIADRLGWPVNSVRGPGHIWIKYRGITQGNIETTGQGGFIPDSQYIKDMRISSVALLNGTYMRPLHKKQFISTLLVNNAYYSIKVKKDTVNAINYLRLSIKYDATNAEAISSLGLITKNEVLIKKADSIGLTNHEYSDDFNIRKGYSIHGKRR